VADPYDNICKATLYWTDFACPHGTYNPAAQASTPDTSCAACAPGAYCPTRASSTTTDCDEGFYCASGSAFAKPMSSLLNVIVYFTAGSGHYCEPGTFCPAGADAPKQCQAGHYCPRPMMPLWSDDDDCLAGYYCTGGASIGTPTDGATGNICPTGHFCEAGSTAADACPDGTFLGDEGGTEEADCRACTPGNYCEGLGRSAETGACAAGYYCPDDDPQNTATPNAYECVRGRYCPAGSADERTCAPTTFTWAAR